MCFQSKCSQRETDAPLTYPPHTHTQSLQQKLDTLICKVFAPKDCKAPTYKNQGEMTLAWEFG